VKKAHKIIKDKALMNRSIIVNSALKDVIKGDVYEELP